eukprot:gene8187-10413_t
MKNSLYVLAGVCTIALSACRKPTEACFTHSPTTSINTSTDVEFDASCSQNAGKYVWSFGDNSDSSTTSSTITHRFTASGTYMVTLGVQSEDGKSSGTDKLI